MIMALIFLTAILTAVRVDLNPEIHYEAIQILGILDDISVLIFAVEIILKWLDSFDKFWTDNWNIFDFLVTLLSSIPENIVGPAAARYLRIFRAIRPLKMIVRFHNLRVIVKTIFDAFQSMAFIMLLLCMIIYLYSVFALNLFYDYSQSDDETLEFQHDFGSIGDAIITLFHLLTLDQWFYIHNDVKRVSSPVLTTFFFISWVFIGAFVFRNIFIGVMVKHFEMVSSAVMKDEQLAIDKETVNKAVKAQKEQDSSQDSSGMKANAKSQINLMKQKMAKKAGRNRKSAGEENETFQLLRSIESLLSTSKSGAESLTWDSNMSRTLNALAAKQIETTWPRDTLFRYLQCMQNLQENIKEHQELQLLAAYALHELHDS